jgi:3-oxoacyl-[acyl-carrier protein] reductase
MNDSRSRQARSSPARSIEGKTAIVTGAASGMGRATAELFAAEGANVVGVDLPGGALGQVVSAAETMSGAMVGVEEDLSDESAPAQVVAAARDAFGPVDILVNNAGVSLPAALDADDWLETWHATFAVNVTAQGLLVRAARDDLRRDGFGRIVNIASTEGLGATRSISAYTASKHAVIGLTRSLVMEFADSGVTVNCVCPGPIRTGMTEIIPEEMKEKFGRRRVPLRRYGEPEEVAHVTLSLVLPAASYITGAVIPVDGGLTLQNT